MGSRRCLPSTSSTSWTCPARPIQPHCGWISIEAGAGLQTYAGALVRRKGAVAEITATGVRRKLGRTAELMRTAHVVTGRTCRR